MAGSQCRFGQDPGCYCHDWSYAEGGKEKVTVQIIGDGPLEQITADGDGEGNVRDMFRTPYVGSSLWQRRGS